MAFRQPLGGSNLSCLSKISLGGFFSPPRPHWVSADQKNRPGTRDRIEKEKGVSKGIPWLMQLMQAPSALAEPSQPIDGVQDEG